MEWTSKGPGSNLEGGLVRGGRSLSQTAADIEHENDMNGGFIEEEVFDGARLILIQKDELLPGQIGENLTVGVKNANRNSDVVGLDLK